MGIALALGLVALPVWANKYQSKSSRSEEKGSAAQKYDNQPAVKTEPEGQVPFVTDGTAPEAAEEVLDAPMAAEPIENLPPSSVPVVNTEEAVNSWFTFGFNDFSLSKIKLILPKFIQLSPESQLLGDVKVNIEGLSQMSITSDAQITGVRVVHKGLSNRPVYIPDVTVKGTIRWNRSDKTVTFQDLQIGRQGVMARVTGNVNYKSATAVKLNVSLPDTPIQSVLAALPDDLIPKVKGAMVAGSIGIDMALNADPARPTEARLEPGIRITGYSLVVDPPGAVIKGLNGEGYVHSVKKNGAVMRQVALSSTNPQFVPYARIGDRIRLAILKAEDIGFMTHNGFNLESTRRALTQNLTSNGYVQGGSTISMQLAKNLYLSGERTLSRKLQEAMLTYALEQELSKERIFEIYANIIEWGVDVYGVHEAAQHYFSKIPSAVTAEEAARLASIIPNPVKRDFNKKDLATTPVVPVIPTDTTITTTTTTTTTAGNEGLVPQFR